MSGENDDSVPRGVASDGCDPSGAEKSVVVSAPGKGKEENDASVTQPSSLLTHHDDMTAATATPPAAAVEGVSHGDEEDESATAASSAAAAAAAAAVAVAPPPCVNKGDGGEGDGDGKVHPMEVEEQNRRSWDHSNRRVIVRNILKYMQGRSIRKMTDGWLRDLNQRRKSGDGPDGDDEKNKNGDSGSGIISEIVFDKVKKPPKDPWIVVTLKEEWMVKTFVDYINTGEHKNKRGDVLHATRSGDDAASGGRDGGGREGEGDDGDDGRNDRKRDRSGDENRGQDNNKKRQRRSVTAEKLSRAARRPVTDDEVRDVVTPLWRMSQEEQLTTKMREMVKKCAQKIVKEIKERFRVLSRSDGRKKVKPYDWFQHRRCIELDPIVSAPTPFRNKFEFTFGYRYLFDGDDGDGGANDTPSGGVGDGGDGGPSAVSSSHPAAAAPAAASATKRVPAVGCVTTGWAGGVSLPHCLGNHPPEACALVDMVNGFLSTSPLPPYDTKVHRGVWRTLTVRSSRRTGECMVIITHAPPAGGAGSTSKNRKGEGEEEEDVQVGDYSQDVFEAERARLVALLTEAELLPAGDDDDDDDDGRRPPVKITSVFFQEFDGVSNPPPDHPVQHCYGETSIRERLDDCTFRISPGAFFQVNTEGAERLYRLVVDQVSAYSSACGRDPERTILFDVCCGTGTIGLTCMKAGAVGRVVGVDVSRPAIEDAKKNAELNGFGVAADADDGAADGDDGGSTEGGKVRFVAARAEKVLSQEIGKAKWLCQREDRSAAEGTASVPSFVAVVDPAREGLHQDVIRTLRSNERIGRVVYVSCNPIATLTRDAALLCAAPTKRYPGRAFRVVKATPVDMFPLTRHCEMVMTFDRVTEADISGGNIVTGNAKGGGAQAAAPKPKGTVATQDQTEDTANAVAESPSASENCPADAKRDTKADHVNAPTDGEKENDEDATMAVAAASTDRDATMEVSK